MKATKAKKIAIALVIIISIFSLVFTMYRLDKVNFKKNFYNLRVSFISVGNLELGTPVLMNGVKVGKVKEVYLTEDAVVANVIIEKKYKIPVGSLVKLSYKGMVGDVRLNIFRKEIIGNTACYKDNDLIIGQDATTIDSILAKVVDISDKINSILATERVEEAKKELKKLLDGFLNALEVGSNDIDKLTSKFTITLDKINKVNVDEMYSEIRAAVIEAKEALASIKKIANSDAIKDSIDNIQEVSKKVNSIAANEYLINPQVGVALNANSDPKLNFSNRLSVNGELDFKIKNKSGVLFRAGKFGFKDLNSGYTFMLGKQVSSFSIMLGLFKNSPGVDLAIYLTKNWNIAVDLYGFDKFKGDVLTTYMLENTTLKLKYDVREKEFWLGVGYLF